MQKTKLNELLIFPCMFTYKVIGLAQPGLIDKVITIVQHYAPGDYSLEIKTSSKGNYNSISIAINANDIDQVETLYKELGGLTGVRMVL